MVSRPAGTEILKPWSGAPLGPMTSISSARDSSARISSASLASASSVTRPCWETTDRYIRPASYDRRALSVPMMLPLT